MSVQPDIAIEINGAAIEAFCRKWRIREFALFGSVLTDEFRPDSDVDVLVTFDEPQPDWGPWMSRWIEMEEELQSIIGRKVDVVEKKAVERSENYIRRRHILEHQRSIYVAR
jgi:predicted nucleotidyltransferase